MEEEGRREEKERCAENEDKIDHHGAMEKGPLCSGPMKHRVFLYLIKEIYDAYLCSCFIREISEKVVGFYETRYM